MIEWIRARLSYANVMATVALFVALGGSATAAVVVTSNSQVAEGTISGHNAPAGKHPNIISGTVNSRDIAENGVGATDLANRAVTTAKLFNDAVTSPKIASGAVTTSKLGLGSVDRGQLAPNAVDGSKVEDGSLTGDDIDQSTLDFVPSTQLLSSGPVVQLADGQTQTLLDTGTIALTGRCRIPAGGGVEATIAIRSSAGAGGLIVASADTDNGHLEVSPSPGGAADIDVFTSTGPEAWDRGDFDAFHLSDEQVPDSSLDGQFIAYANSLVGCWYSAVGVAG